MAQYQNGDDMSRHRTCLNATSPSRITNHETSVHSTADNHPTIPSKTTARRYRTCSNALSPMTLLLALLISIIFFASPAASAEVAFQNCLSDDYRAVNEPKNLQLVPKFADASFKKNGKHYTLSYTAWTDVAGQYNRDDPVPDYKENLTYWNDIDQKNGKIADSNDGKKGTTLIRRVTVLSYEPVDDGVLFCQDALVNGTCPLAPQFAQETLTKLNLPSVNLTHEFSSSYSFASFATTFLVIYGDDKATNIGCISSVVTPALDGKRHIIQFLPLAVLIFCGFGVMLAAIFSPWGSSDVFSWSSNYGRDADLLRLVTPGFADCLQYIQFVVLTGGLSLSYPGFYQPIVSQLGWSALMFNESFVMDANGYQSVVDGIYVYKNARYGMHKLGQLVGMEKDQDIWAGLMVWLCVIILATFAAVQICFLIQWLYRKIQNTPEEDLRAKNLPFSIGNVVRIVFNFMLLPIISLTTFQLCIAKDSPSYVVALAAITIVVLIGFAGYLLWFIIKTKPKAVLFDDLPTVLRFGPLYNTYSDDAAAFALFPFLLTFVRGVAIGAVQPSGVAQVVLLAICEVIYIVTLHAFKPFHSPTSMNAYHTIFAVLRFITMLLFLAFVPSLGVTEGPKGWIGYAVLVVHACVLIFGFFLSTLQTVVEVVARMLGAGGDDASGLRRGGLTKIFGMRQLDRRENHRLGQSRASQLSTSAMIDAANGTKAGGYVMPGGRVRSGSGASLSAIMQRNSVLESADMYSSAPRTLDSPTSYMPGTPGQASTFSFVGGQQGPARAMPASLAALEAADPYYRPPRRRRETSGEEFLTDPQRVSLIVDPKTNLQPPGPEQFPPSALEAQDLSRGTTPVPGGTPTPAPGTAGANQVVNLPPNQPDYATREVDFYYGVRGPALNSDHIGRKLGTGPADPTGPIATATGWIRNMFGGKSKDKSKGFEVVRSSRMPQSMVARNGAYGDETPPEGIPVAMGVLRNGPIDSDDDDVPEAKADSPRHKEVNLLDDSGDPQEVSDDDDDDEQQPPMSPLSDDIPEIPRKSSKRDSANLGPMHAHTSSLSAIESNSSSRLHQEEDGTALRGHKHNLSSSATPHLNPLPFERTQSQKRLSSRSSMEFSEAFTNIDLSTLAGDRPASFGVVPQHGISRIDPTHPHMGSAAELVDEDGNPKGM